MGRNWFLYRRLALFAGLCVGVFGSGCSRTIGDACANNVECSALGDRFCDVASPGGYCTVEGCDQNSCPDSSACVRFFSLQKGRASCNVRKVTRASCPSNDSAECCKPGDLGCCGLGERCLCDTPDCQNGFCAAEASERRFCMNPCDIDDDCRAGYVCATTGALGTLSVAYRNSDGNVEQPVVRYCAPPK